MKKPPIDGQLYVHVKNFSDSAANEKVVNETITEDIEKGNAITSLVAGDVTKHKVIIDLDIPAKLIDSSTPGHHHLYIDHQMTKEAYFKLLDALVEAGLVESGYVGASERRGYTAVRLPWVEKTQEERDRTEARKRAEAEAAEVFPFPF